MKKNNILITGCGGDIGLGLGKIIRSQDFVSQLIGADIDLDTPASIYCDSVCALPRASDAWYLSELENLVSDSGIDIILPASEPEIRFFAKNKKSDINGVPLLIVNQKALDIGFNKYKTYEFLKSNLLPYPWTKMVTDGAPQELPCIYKNIEGSGSKTVQIIDVGTNVQSLTDDPQYLWQELLLPHDQEYTCAVYRCKNGDIRTIIFRRELGGGGYTKKAIVVENDSIKQVLVKIAKELDLRGSINVQLRLTDKGPVVFEINPRFSSTVVFRHILGFKDCVWSFQEAFGVALDKEEYIEPGQRLYKIFDEVILS